MENNDRTIRSDSSPPSYGACVNEGVSSEDGSISCNRHARKCHNGESLDSQSELAPLLENSSTEKTNEDEADDSQKMKNLIVSYVLLSIYMIGGSVYIDTFSQWVYVYFEKEVVGKNFSLLNVSTSSNPCLSTHSAYKKELTVAQEKASDFNTWILLILLFPALASNTVFGAYSDKIGRKFLFIFPMFGSFCRMAISSAVCFWSLDISFIYIAVAIEGACGSNSALFMGVYVYTADNTPKNKKRSFAMVFAQLLATVSYSVTRLGTGIFIGSLGYFWPMFTSTMIAFTTTAGTIILLRETLQRQEAGGWQHFINGVTRVFSFYLVKSINPRYKRKDFILLIVAFFLFATCIGATIQTLYLMGHPFCWSSTKIGFVTSLQGLLPSIGSVVVMRVLQRFTSDEVICVIALLSGAGNRIMFAFAWTDWMVYAAFSIGLTDSLAIPILRSIMSRMVTTDKQGSLFASVAVVEVGIIAISGAGLNALYSATVSKWRGLAYIVISLCMLIAAVLVCTYILLMKHRPPEVKSLVVVVEEHVPINSEGSINENGDHQVH